MKVDVDALLSAAHSASPPVSSASHRRTRAERYEREALETLARSLPCEAITYMRPEGPGTQLGLSHEQEWRETLRSRNAAYEIELSDFIRETMQDGVGVDAEFYGFGRLARTAYHRELIAAQHEGGRVMYGMLRFGGRHVATVALGRRQRGFDAREKDALRAALPALAVCEVAMRSVHAQAPRARELVRALSAREREILDFLRLGYDNRQIALALGTSPNTVRNQLVKLFRRLEVGNRAEAVGRAFGPTD